MRAINGVVGGEGKGCGRGSAQHGHGGGRQEVGGGEG
jgi:hypothetical protein